MPPVVTWNDEHGSGITGLPIRNKFTVVYLDEDGRPPKDGEPGDLAVRQGESKGFMAFSPFVRVGDGWHRAGTVTVDQDEPQYTEVKTWDGGVIRRDETDPRIRVTVEGLEAYPTIFMEPMKPLDSVHPDWRYAGGCWLCVACGAETMDEELFREAGCQAIQ